MITRLDLASGRYGQAPSPPVVTITRLRRAGHDGVDLRLADRPDHGLVRILGDRAQLGPCAGLLDRRLFVVQTAELQVLARLVVAWRDARGGWPAYSLGFHGPGYGSRQSVRYPRGSWAPERLATLDAWRPGELTFSAVAPTAEENLAGLPIEVVLQNAIGERIGVALRTPGGNCVIGVRASLVVCARGPTDTSHYGPIAQLLACAQTNDRNGNALSCLDEAADFDALAACLIDVAASLGESGCRADESPVSRP